MTRNNLILIAQRLCDSLEHTLDMLYEMEEAEDARGYFTQIRAHIRGSLLIEDGKNLQERLEQLQADSEVTLNPDLTPLPWSWIASNWTPEKGPRVVIHGDIDSDESTDATADDLALMADAPQLLLALRNLHDEQNGPPLERRKQAWKDAMEDAYFMLKKHNG